MAHITTIVLWLGLTAAGAGVPEPPRPRVVDVRVVADTLDVKRWRTTGPVKFSESEKAAPGTGAKALRAEVSLTREARKTRSFTGQILELQEPQDWSAWNRLALWVFVEPSRTMRGGGVSMHLYNKDKLRRTTGPYIVPRGKWREVVWDITPMPRSSVGKLMISQGVHRHNPGEADRNVFHFGRLELRRVEPPTKFRGWELQPHRVAFSHVGYVPGGEKTAVFHGDVGESVRLMDVESGRVVWTGKLEAASAPRTGRFKVADFSAWRRQGRYVLVADGPKGPVATESFAVAPRVYEPAVRLMLDFYRAERCGGAAPGYHLACHLDDGLVGPYEGMAPERFAPEVRALFGKHVDCSGGWHDAGDMAKFAYQEYNSAAQMLRLHERGLRHPRPGGGRDGALDEAIWGVRYALNTLLPTGRNCDRPDRVGLGVWTDNVPGNDDDRQVGMTTWRAVERYIAGMMAEALAARLLRQADPPLAERCLKQARLEAEAYLTGAVKDWREHPSPIKYASVGLAFLELHRATDEPRYQAEAARCGDELAACQEQGLAWNDLGITGFWYEGPERRHPFAHSCGDGRPAYLLAELCRAFPDHPSWMKWYAALRIYARFYALATSAHLAPYGIPAFSVHDGPEQSYQYWDRVRVLGERQRRKLDFRFERLIRVGRRYLVRIRDCNSSVTMNAATLAAVADVAGDAEAEAMAQRCIQWVLGRNPFSRSQIWAIGRRYREQPHYVATHDEMPGGIACKGIDGRLDGDGAYHDEPFSDPLPRCVINEVCIAQAGYFLTACRELAFSPTLSGVVHGKPRPAEIVARFADLAADVVARAPIGESGEYSLTLPGGGLYDIACGPLRRRHFVASATRRRLDLDLDHEIAVSAQCPDEVEPDAPFVLRVAARRLGRGRKTTRHQLDLRLHNLACARPRQTVELAGGEPATATFALTPRRPAEPFLILVVPDGQLTKRAERIGVVARPH